MKLLTVAMLFLLFVVFDAAVKTPFEEVAYTTCYGDIHRIDGRRVTCGDGSVHYIVPLEAK